MPQNIKINNVKALRFRCKYDEYYDYMLYRGECYGPGSFDCLAAFITADELQTGEVKAGDTVHSKGEWENAQNEGTLMEDIGFTGIDNGLITYRKDQITNQQFLDILTGSTFSIEEGEKRFFMNPVSGNTRMFKYPMEVNEDEHGKYFSMKGGFYQGFYKLYGFDYQTLPSYIEKDWNMSFVLRRRDYEVEANTLNNLHPENNGIFFYMGTRAENKFWHYYHTEGMEEYRLVDEDAEPYVNWGEIQNYVTDYPDYVQDEVGNYFDDGYFQREDTNADGYSIDPEYWESDIDLYNLSLVTSLGYDIDKRGYYEIETDNKFIFFNRTCTGFTVNNWTEGDTVVLTGRTDWDTDENYFITFNRTCTGKTVNTVDDSRYIKTKTKDGKIVYKEDVSQTKVFDIFKDIKNNAFALKINEDGSIGYQYGMLYCDCDQDDLSPDESKHCTDEEREKHYKVMKEVSKPGLIPMDKWVHVDVRFKILNPVYSQCITNSGMTVTQVPSKIGERKMKIYIYVDGYLVLISKELPEFRFRELDDIFQKQEAVPYSLSLGGGTQGLLEEIHLNYYKITDYCLPIERDFAGTFLGDIREFKFHPCFLDYPTIRQKAVSVRQEFGG